MASTSWARICDLPDDVLLSIFNLLPVADLARCAATCDRWHGIVTGFTHLWKGKDYSSTRSPTECAETRAVLQALPPLLEVNIDVRDDFMLFISYPCLDLSENCVTVMKGSQRLRCKLLSTTTNIAGDVLSFPPTIDLEGLQQLRLRQTWMPNFWAINYCSADNVVCTAMRLCPSLRSLSITAVFLTAEYLDAVQELGQLHYLEIQCPRLYKLSFLRHCSSTLEELQLLGCTGLPSHEFSELSRLKNLRRLLLTHCRYEEGDLAAAMAGLTNLESLQLESCSLIRDLSILHHCRQLRELHITYSSMQERQVNVTPGGQQIQLHDVRLPTNTDNPWGDVVGISVTVDDMSTALCRLEELGLKSSCLAYLSAMRHCSQLRHLSCEFICRYSPLGRLNVRIHITLTGST